MTVTFFTNYIHHHQTPLADELFKRLGNDYKYVAMEELPESFVKGGYDPTIDRPYLIKAYESEDAANEAKRLMLESDIVIGLAGPKGYSEIRQQQNKITFNYSERWNKRSFIHAVDPRILYRIYNSFFKFRGKRSYMLCASAYAANDASFYHCYPNKCYKWGYFPSVATRIYERGERNYSGSVKLMWCSRFIKWKHPELAIYTAKKLKDEGFDFHLDMIGGGDELENIQTLTKKLNIGDCVSFLGNMPNEQVLKAMSEHDIFLFTSDKNEGWGAVLNESMSQGCAVVASDKIGAVPFLINDGENGLIFKSGDINSLYSQTKRLLEDCHLREKLSRNAIKTMQEEWSPKVAAERFLSLATNILNGKDTEFQDGPCSKAYPYNHTK